MPRVARFTIDSIAELTRQLRFAPPETRAKQMDAAEAFAAEIEHDQLYPEDFVIFRITGYRPQQIENPAILVGKALLGDLVNFIQHLSDDLRLPPDYRGRSALPLDEVASRLNIASKTVQRYRRQGLICHYVHFGEDDQRLACFEDALTRFVNGHTSQVRKAGQFSRLDDATGRVIVEEARSLRENRRVSLNEAALILAKKHGRAHETIRLILRKHDRRSENPVFTERGPLTERDGRVLHRAWRFGVTVSLMAKRYGRTATTIHRAINRRRGELLRGLDLHFVELPTFAREDAADVLLAVSAVRENLDDLLPGHDALVLLESAKDFATNHETEVSLLAAYNFLKRRATQGVARIGDAPSATLLDEIETALRWAGRIKRRLICFGLHTAIGRIEQNLHRPLPQQPTDRIVAAIQTAVSIVSDVIETLDPSKGQRLARVVAYAADRALAKDDRLIEAPGRAAVRHIGEITMRDPFENISPWDGYLCLSKRFTAHLSKLEDAARTLIEHRYGSSVNPPHTLAQIAARHGSTTARVTARLTQAEQFLRECARPDDHTERHP